jgi:hypothetical protein
LPHPRNEEGMGTIPTTAGAAAGAAKCSSHPSHPHSGETLQLPHLNYRLHLPHSLARACRSELPRRVSAAEEGPDGESLRRRRAPAAGPDGDLEPLCWRRAAPASGPCSGDELRPTAPPSCRREDGGGDDLTGLAPPPNPSSLDPRARRRDPAASPCGESEPRRWAPTATSSPCVGGEPRRPRPLAAATSSGRRRLLPAAVKMEEATISPA